MLAVSYMAFVYDYVDLLYVFSNMSRNVNFIENMQLTGWKL